MNTDKILLANSLTERPLFLRRMKHVVAGSCRFQAYRFPAGGHGDCAMPSLLDAKDWLALLRL